MCAAVSMCVCSWWVDHSVASSQDPSSPSIFDEALMHYFLHNAPNIGHCPLPVLQKLPGVSHQARARAPASCRVGTSKKCCHKLSMASFHLCPSNDCVPVFGRKMGLCGAQRSESPKAARQIQPLWSAMAPVATIPSSSFKLHFP